MKTNTTYKTVQVATMEGQRSMIVAIKTRTTRKLDSSPAIVATRGESIRCFRISDEGTKALAEAVYCQIRPIDCQLESHELETDYDRPDKKMVALLELFNGIPSPKQPHNEGKILFREPVIKSVQAFNPKRLSDTLMQVFSLAAKTQAVTPKVALYEESYRLEERMATLTEAEREHELLLYLQRMRSQIGSSQRFDEFYENKLNVIQSYHQFDPRLKRWFDYYSGGKPFLVDDGTFQHIRAYFIECFDRTDLAYFITNLCGNMFRPEDQPLTPENIFRCICARVAPPEKILVSIYGGNHEAEITQSLEQLRNPVNVTSN